MRLVPYLEPLFHDRAEAGRALAEALAREPGAASDVVVGVARGGVAVAAEVAQALGLPLTAIDVERVNARGLRLGAVSGQGPPYLREGHGMPEEEAQEAVARARLRAQALEERLEHEPLPLAGAHALLVDDGAVTGLTLAAACRFARWAGAGRLAAAVPVAHPRALERLREEADAVVCPHPLAELVVVGQAYHLFDPLEEWYVAALLAEAGGG